MQGQQGWQVRNGIDNSTVNGNTFQARELTVNLPPAPADAQWPMVIGRIPPRASAFQPRDELRQAIDAAREQHGTVVLSQVLAGGGGVGKSQLAGHYARAAIDAGTGLVLWVDAADPGNVTHVYARAAATVRVPGLGGTAEEDAEKFLTWLASTDRSWLIILDNATEHTPESLWPATSRGARGRVIATTRHRGAASTGSDRTLVNIGTYSPAESAAYLRERMERAGCSHFLDEHAAELAEALGHLPLALAHAAAYMINTRRSCGRYLGLFRDLTRSLDAVLPARSSADGYRGPVTAALLLAVDAAQKEHPVGLALPVLQLAALLDPAGHPRQLWTTAPVLDHLSRIRGTSIADDDALDALAVLHNYNLYNLVTLTETPHREVSLHALTARAVLGTPYDREPYQNAIAEGLIGLWPNEDYSFRDLAAVLRANTDALITQSGDLLWNLSTGAHQLFNRVGHSLLNAGLYTAGIQHWGLVIAVLERTYGADDLNTLTCRSNLATSYRRAGRTDDAVALQERVLADHERIFGSDHPETLICRNNLATSYQQAGRTDDAIRLQERVLADHEHSLGSDHPDILTCRNNLAMSHWQAGRGREAIAMLSRTLADGERVLGVNHPSTVLTRENLLALARRQDPAPPDRDLPQREAAQDNSSRRESSDGVSGSAV
ncbi:MULTISPECIES: tetratricopeptide repeat protein [Streptomyces]|uniref:tetratricopeptide repeat protein n=1 Tax=Streptomyces TaxID=1883 RepID=UPI000A79E36B|nr:MULTISPECIES: tetratricopeptide repeat protein [Streptomyces]